MYVIVPKVGGVKSFNFAGKHQVEYPNHQGCMKIHYATFWD